MPKNKTSQLPENYPTHRHPAELWEQLGRAVATFGFLEEMLKKAILAFEGYQPYSEAKHEEFEKLIKSMAPSTLGALIAPYKKAAYKYYNTPQQQVSINSLIDDLESLKDYRNPICHASWYAPDEEGKSKIFFIRRNGLLSFDTKIDTAFLIQTRVHTAEVADSVIKSVIAANLDFPGMEQGII